MTNANPSKFLFLDQAENRSSGNLVLQFDSKLKDLFYLLIVSK
jgi:hypothetical protein